MDSLRDYSRCVLRCPRASQLLKAADNREGDLPYSIIHSPSFTFLVGPKHTKLTIQSGLAHHVSKPLHNLMNNGHTRESKHRIAVLEDEDVETFVAFCEYAYTGDYNVPLPPAIPEDYRASVVESAPSAGNSWRETLRADSVSSAVPPKPPSPPPEDIEPASQVEMAPETVPTSTIEEVSAEAETEADSNEAEGQEVDVPDDVLADNEETADLANQATDAAVPEETSEQLDVNLAVQPEEWTQWPTQYSKTKKHKKKERRKKRQEADWTDEAASNLTPPSTPPNHVLNADEVPPEDAPEETAEPEPPTDFERSERQPTEEPLAEPTVPEHALDECEQPSTSPTCEEDVQHQGPWIEDEVDDANTADDDHERPKPIIDMSFAKQSDSSPRTPGLSLWDEFAALQYPDDQQVAQPTFDSSIRSEIPYLTFHAKVYVFATRYLIPALAQLCLRKLHRDLLQLSFADIDPTDPCPAETEHLGGLAARQAPMVLDLLRYAYTKTTRLEPISPTSATQLRENELRRLVVHYAACKVKELARYHSPGDSETATPSIRPVDAKVERADDAAPKSLRALLDMTPELASDLVYRMM